MKLTFVTVASLVCTVISQSTTFSSSGLFVDVLGQSGKVRIGRNQIPSQDPEHITIEIDSLRELNANNDAIGNTGPPSQKHSIQTFAPLDFTFSSLYDTEVAGVESVALDFKTTMLDNTAELIVTIYLFKDSGNLTVNGTETFSLNPGASKFNVNITGWTFCENGGSGLASCNGQTGEKIEMDIKIKGSDDTVEKVTGSDSKFTLGGGKTIDMSALVDRDGDWRPMEAGYPKLHTVGNSQVFTIRLPKFSSSVLYDPVIDGFSSSPTEETSDLTLILSLSIGGFILSLILIYFLIKK